ncbi:MAG: diguanylate cyclase [Candidatus Omnitrophica bacterium]|nr:diguanylate cyclase [Candidatus Omnitrophota bacterium]
MKIKKFFFFNIGLAFIVSAAIAFLSQIGCLERLRLAGLDILFQLRGPLPSSDKIIIIELDEDCIFKVGRWPWKRTWHAALTRAVRQLGAKALYFDILFSEEASGEEDDVFSGSIEEAGNVYLPFAFPERTTDVENALFPIEKFSAYAKGIGSFNSYPDSDGTLRSLPVIFYAEDDVYFHIALKLAMDYDGLKFIEIKDGDIILFDSKNEIRVPTIDGQKMLINWLDRWKYTFKHYSYLDVLTAYQDMSEGRKPSINTEPFRDSICLVGATAIGLYDIAAIPIEAEYPAIGAIATTVNNILDRRFIRNIGGRTYWSLIVVLALIPSLLISGERVTRETLFTAFVAALFIVGDLLLFKRQLWMDPALPLLSLLSSHIAVTTYNFIRISAERKSFFSLAVTDGLTQLFNIRYFKIILKTECMMAKSEVRKQFCIVMTDIDHFKHFNDTYGHRVGDLVLRKVSDVLKNTVRSSDVVARYGGEEMIVLLGGADLKGGLNVAEELRKRVESQEIADGKNVYKVTISVGVANFNSKDNEESIIQRADEGLYKAKNSGRNRVETVENRP